MPPKAKAQPTVVRYLYQSGAGDVFWSDIPPRYAHATTIVAYGWSDGLVTWGTFR